MTRLTALCAGCGGRCCRNHLVVLSGKEFARLKEVLDFREGFIDSPYGRMGAIDALRGCPFTGPDGRCILKGKDRPLVCRLYPLTFTAGKKGVSFHLSKLCPCLEDVRALKSWIEEARRGCLAELEACRTRKEILCYGIFLRKSCDQLVELP
ncbi:MAG: YkgJ family cysteine cluster protein [Candidatus Altiarchaeota archaeon]|nr:YkgJ family cysteine cluster protein [Candidatus Altiarchaeota archaeon]